MEADLSNTRAAYYLSATAAYGLHQYADATGDSDLLKGSGGELLIETARLWEDFGFYSSLDDCFHLPGVSGPDQYAGKSNDNFFSNLMARYNLACAADLINDLRTNSTEAFEDLSLRTDLQEGEASRWAMAASAMHVGFDAGLGINPQDSNFLFKEDWRYTELRDQAPRLGEFSDQVLERFKVNYTPDVLLASWILGTELTTEEKRRNFDFYEKIAARSAPTTLGVLAIIAAEVGRLDDASQYLRDALSSVLSPELDTAEGLPVAALAMSWASVVCGCGGFRNLGGTPYFNPKLPANIEGVTFVATWRGSQIRVEVGSSQSTFEALSGPPITIYVRTGRHVLAPSDRITVDTWTTPEHFNVRGDSSSRPAGASRQRSVFISYARADEAYVEELCQVLESEGVRTWFDRSIAHGTRWEDVLERKIDECSAVLVVVSQDAQASRWVGKEIDRARLQGKPLFPLRRSGTHMPQLADLQEEDVSDGSRPSERFIDGLREALRRG